MTILSASASLLICLLPLSALATPVVRGFDRFHSDVPTPEGGRLLFNELGCVNCHDKETGLPRRRGPILTNVAHRLRQEWLQSFLIDSLRTQPGATMPHFLQMQNREEAEAVHSYLLSLSSGSRPPGNRARHVNSKRGHELFLTIGCAACHSDWTPPPEGFDEKYTLSSLSEFVLNPLKSRPEGRMPSIAMEHQDAIDIAGYLLKFEGSDGRESAHLKLPAVTPERIEKGRAIVKESLCANCHELPDQTGSPPIALRRTENGCLDADKTGIVPHYELTENQRSALTLYLNQETEQPPAERAMLTLQALDCLACHERDTKGGPTSSTISYFKGDSSLGDTGRIPPPLTGIGQKLQPDWLQGVLSGEHRVRPYLQTRMPVYGSATSTLAPLLTAVDRMKIGKTFAGGDDTAGRKLLGTVGGLGCITCHQWGQRPSLGIQALDISNLGQRLNPGWIHDYLINPDIHRPGTLMPSFWPAGIASNKEILNGNTERQIASIISFAKSANGEPEGNPDTSSGQFELIPKETPIVLRTFMKDVGTHAILAGFPAGFHLAYDGKEGHPSIAWKGRFFDAYNTWFSRFAPFEKPLGESTIKWPAPDTKRSFNGYRLDATKNPVFLFKISDVLVEERFSADDSGLRRSVQWDAVSLPDLQITHPANVSITVSDDNRPGNYSFIYQWE